MIEKPTVHLVYPTDERRSSSPWSVGNHLLEGLQEQFEVQVHDWDAKYSIEHEPNDILIGHPHPRRKTVFRKSFHDQWASRYVICPFTTNPQQMYFVEPYVNEADAFFAICGPFWANRLRDSIYSHLEKKFVHLDMAIDVQDWQPLGKAFPPPGKRRFAYIGSSLALKGTPFLEHLAARRPPGEIGWIGASSWVRSNAHCIDYLDLNTDNGRRSLAEFDFVISPGRSDANPTVLLEAMSLGLIPICTKESGYDDMEHFYIMEYGNIAAGVDLLQLLQNLPSEELLLRQKLNLAYVNSFTWERFIRTVCKRIVDDFKIDNRRTIHEIPPKTRPIDMLRSWKSPYRRWRSSGILKIIENRFYFRYAQILRKVSR